jgi:type I restriction enzyme, S subunit
MTEWKEDVLGNLIEVKYGKDHKKLQVGNIPCFGSGGLMRYVNDKLYDKPSILIPRKGSLNKIMYQNKPFWTVDTMFWTKINEDKAFPKFLFYQLTLIDYTNLNVGSAVPSLTVPVINEIEINLPSLPEQRAIASILSGLDDKTNLLHRQNKTLEQMAETLFRQWFVVEASDIKLLGDCIKTTSGGTPSRKRMDYYENGIYQWIKSKELNGGYILETEEKITEEALKNSSAKLLPENSVLIAMYGATVGQFAIIGQEATCNQAICACVPNDSYPYTFIYHTIKFNVNELKSRAVGSAQQNISQVLIKSLDIAVNDNIGRFHLEVDPMMKKIKSNYNQIRTLEKLRDTLLPKLMSGEVKVKYEMGHH